MKTQKSNNNKSLLIRLQLVTSCMLITLTHTQTDWQDCVQFTQYHEYAGSCWRATIRILKEWLWFCSIGAWSNDAKPLQHIHNRDRRGGWSSRPWRIARFSECRSCHWRNPGCCGIVHIEPVGPVSTALKMTAEVTLTVVYLWSLTSSWTCHQPFCIPSFVFGSFVTCFPADHLPSLLTYSCIAINVELLQDFFKMSLSVVKCHFITVQQLLVLMWKGKLSDVCFAELDVVTSLCPSCLIWSVQATQFLS